MAAVVKPELTFKTTRTGGRQHCAQRIRFERAGQHLLIKLRISFELLATVNSGIEQVNLQAFRIRPEIEVWKGSVGLCVKYEGFIFHNMCPSGRPVTISKPCCCV